MIVWGVVREGRTMFVCKHEKDAQDWVNSEMRRENGRRRLLGQPQLSTPRDYITPLKLVGE